VQGSGLAVGFVIGLAIVGANLPFVNERMFGVLAWPPSIDAIGGQRVRIKPLWFRCIELLVMYAVIAGLARLVEQRIGPVAKQGWEFYAITACLFIVASYPGFVWRYLRRGGRHPEGS
jgi:hypothetical protein